MAVILSAVILAFCHAQNVIGLTLLADPVGERGLTLLTNPVGEQGAEELDDESVEMCGVPVELLDSAYCQELEMTRRMPYRSNGCQTCWMNAEDAPALWVRARVDGLGMVLLSILYAMSFAGKHGLNFGGVLQSRRCLRHGENMSVVLPALFGGSTYEEMWLDKGAKVHFWGGVFKQTSELLEHGVPNKLVDVFIEDKWIGNSDMKHAFPNLDDYMTPAFLAAFRSQTSLPLQWAGANGSQLRVAMHLRRGDVDPTHQCQRWVSTARAYDIIAQIRRALPSAEIHVFTTTEGKYNASYFDGFRDRAVAVHLDGEVLDDWAYMSQADVFVMAPSAFSHIAALLNPNCIVYQKFAYSPLKAWINDTSLSFVSELKACVARVRERRAPTVAGSASV